MMLNGLWTIQKTCSIIDNDLKEVYHAHTSGQNSKESKVMLEPRHSPLLMGSRKTERKIHKVEINCKQLACLLREDYGGLGTTNVKTGSSDAY